MTLSVPGSRQAGFRGQCHFSIPEPPFLQWNSSDWVPASCRRERGKTGERAIKGLKGCPEEPKKSIEVSQRDEKDGMEKIERE